ncbi:MAG: GNAT family N-acetyltransferase [Pseudodesulfovibrio sp.]|uniref:GNAT family N-acetyltransferase n=1 Tax=Pseudodesulfovibrio sp. TaxID=2035812 RepID=UPI003D1436FD
MPDRITFESLAPEREAEALALVRTVFDAMVAPGFSEQGRVSFNDYLARFAFSRREGEGFALAAMRDGVPVGVIEVVGGNHVALFFVSEGYRGRGVGSGLMRLAVERCGRGEPRPVALTVNASPGSVKAYARLGFAADSGERERDGIRFVPMTLPLQPL